MCDLLLENDSFGYIASLSVQECIIRVSVLCIRCSERIGVSLNWSTCIVARCIIFVRAQVYFNFRPFKQYCTALPSFTSRTFNYLALSFLVMALYALVRHAWIVRIKPVHSSARIVRKESSTPKPQGGRQ